jgi:hypothetical protein
MIAALQLHDCPNRRRKHKVWAVLWSASIPSLNLMSKCTILSTAARAHAPLRTHVSCRRRRCCCRRCCRHRRRRCRRRCRHHCRWCCRRRCCCRHHCRRCHHHRAGAGVWRARRAGEGLAQRPGAAIHLQSVPDGGIPKTHTSEVIGCTARTDVLQTSESFTKLWKIWRAAEADCWRLLAYCTPPLPACQVCSEPSVRSLSWDAAGGRILVLYWLAIRVSALNPDRNRLATRS